MSNLIELMNKFRVISCGTVIDGVFLVFETDILPRHLEENENKFMGGSAFDVVSFNVKIGHQGEIFIYLEECDPYAKLGGKRTGQSIQVLLDKKVSDTSTIVNRELIAKLRYYMDDDTNERGKICMTIDDINRFTESIDNA